MKKTSFNSLMIFFFLFNFEDISKIFSIVQELKTNFSIVYNWKNKFLKVQGGKTNF